MRQQYAVSSRHYAETAAAAGTPQRRRVLFLPAACRPLPTHRRGFTFTEVMFAVILLGIGFIMLAGMFPVAIQQTAQTQQETVGANLTLAAVKQISQIATIDNMFNTGQWASGTTVPFVAPRVISFREVFIPGAPNSNPTWPIARSIETNQANVTAANPLNPLWKMIRGDVISTEDARYGFIPFYQRTPDQNVAKLIVIAVQNQTTGTYVHGRDTLDYNEPIAREPYITLEPRRLEAIISDGGPDPDIIELRTPRVPKINGADPIGCVAEGAFVVISADGIVSTSAGADPIGWNAGDDRGRANGRIYRIGLRREDLDGTNLSGGRTWELVPGYDLATRMENLPMPKDPGVQPPVWDPQQNGYNDHDGKNPATVYVVGRPQDPNSGEYTGLAQDLAAYATYINLK